LMTCSMALRWAVVIVIVCWLYVTVKLEYRLNLQVEYALLLAITPLFARVTNPF
jgi:hypothetical protein